MKSKYLKPDIASIDMLYCNIICICSGIDPGGIGHDFDWGNDKENILEGNGDDFNWGN